ncbi:MAG: (2Fe-2S)-binding protein [Desulfobacterales bacterium]|jgi:sarcosine oxidase subunit alpha|nr:(2Fe-2S)-binding protein [Desulfobacterales bacterium]
MSGLRIKRRRRGRPLTLRINGKPVTACAGETLFAVLLAEGILSLRYPSDGLTEAARGGFCGMGVCQECRVTVDGAPDQRACMIEVRAGMEVLTGGR